MVARAFWLALLSVVVCLAQNGAATLSGTVTDSGGSPIENAKAQIESSDANAPPYFVRTDNLGHFRIFDVPPGTYRLAVYSPTFKTSFRNGIRLFTGRETVFANIVLNLATFVGACEPLVDAMQRLGPGDTSGTMRGSVLDNRDLPIGSASVSLNCDGCVTKTNLDGQFTFTNLKPGSYVVSVSKTGFYRKFLPTYSVAKNLDWTYAPIKLEPCPAEGCRGTPRPQKIGPHCE